MSRERSRPGTSLAAENLDAPVSLLPRVCAEFLESLDTAGRCLRHSSVSPETVSNAQRKPGHPVAPEWDEVVHIVDLDRRPHKDVVTDIEPRSSRHMDQKIV
jgi:hypothetical protein